MSYDGEIVDGKGECQECGGWYTIKKDGEIRSHNCPGVIAIPAGDKPSATKATRRNSSTKKTRDVPDAVAKLTIAAVASIAEGISRTTVARACGFERSDVPEELVTLPEPEAMIKPFVSLAWPQIPGKAQRIIRDVADHSDVIDALLQWHEWLLTMREFVRLSRDHRARLEGSGSVVPIQSAPTGSVASSGAQPFFTPFQPASEPVG